MPKTITLPLVGSEVGTAGLRWVEGANGSRRIPGHDGVRRDVVEHDGLRPDDRALSDRHAGQHADVEADPDVGFQPYRPGLIWIAQRSLVLPGRVEDDLTPSR